MSDFGKFHAATGGDEFKFIKHNEVDYDAFKNFQSSINEKFSKIEKNNAAKTRKENLRIWDERLAERWRGASLQKLAKSGDSAAITAIKLIDQNKLDNFYISGESGVGKTYLAYAIIRRYIGRGYISPSQVKVISEETLMSYAMTGFEGRSKFDALLDPKFKLYLFDNVGSKESYDARREVPFWEQLIQHIYSNGLSAIFTSLEPPQIFARILNDSGDSKFRYMVNNRVLTRSGSRTPNLEPQNSVDGYSAEPKSVLDEFDG